MKKIAEISVQKLMDKYPDLSHLGEYTSTPSAADLNAGKVVDREHLGDRRPGQFRYFVAALSGDETGNPDSVMEDYRRMEAYDQGDLHMVVIRAVAKIVVNDVRQTIASEGLWGIESDSERSHFLEVASEQLAQLARILKTLGFPPEEIAEAVKAAVL